MLYENFREFLQFLRKFAYFATCPNFQNEIDILSVAITFYGCKSSSTWINQSDFSWSCLIPRWYANYFYYLFYFLVSSVSNLDWPQFLRFRFCSDTFYFIQTKFRIRFFLKFFKSGRSNGVKNELSILLWYFFIFQRDFLKIYFDRKLKKKTFLRVTGRVFHETRFLTFQLESFRGQKGLKNMPP